MGNCCNDDYIRTNDFTAIHSAIYDVFVSECVQSGCPQTPQQLIDAYNSRVQVGSKPPLNGAQIQSVPSAYCGDFSNTGDFTTDDVALYDVFVSECIQSGCPQTVAELESAYNARVDVGARPNLGSVQCDHLPSLITDTDIITRTGPVTKGCVYIDGGIREANDGFINSGDIKVPRWLARFSNKPVAHTDGATKLSNNEDDNWSAGKSFSQIGEHYPIEKTQDGTYRIYVNQPLYGGDVIGRVAWLAFHTESDINVGDNQDIKVGYVRSTFGRTTTSRPMTSMTVSSVVSDVVTTNESINGYVNPGDYVVFAGDGSTYTVISVDGTHEFTIDTSLSDIRPGTAISRSRDNTFIEHIYSKWDASGGIDPDVELTVTETGDASYNYWTWNPSKNTVSIPHAVTSYPGWEADDFNHYVLSYIEVSNDTLESFV